MYVDPITRQNYDYATPIACDNNPRNIIELDSTNVKTLQNFPHYLLVQQLFKRLKHFNGRTNPSHALTSHFC